MSDVIPFKGEPVLIKSKSIVSYINVEVVTNGFLVKFNVNSLEFIKVYKTHELNDVLGEIHDTLKGSVHGN